MTCPTCQHEATSIKTRLVNGEQVTGCGFCLNPKNIAVFARKYKRDRMKEDHRKDLVQRFDNSNRPSAEYAKLYPQQAKQQFGRLMPRI